MRLDIFTIAMTMAVLWIGGILGGFVVAYLPFTGSAWIDALIIGIIQIALLGVIGTTSGKLTLWTLIFGFILILIGGLLGGFLVDFIGYTDRLWNPAIILFVQTAMLMMFGIIGKGKQSTPLKV